MRGEEPYAAAEAALAWEAAYARANEILDGARHAAVVVSPMLSCEEAYLLAGLATERLEQVTFAVGPIPRAGEDKTFPGGFTMYAEKAPNARGVRRVLEKYSSNVLDYESFLGRLGGDREIDALLLTGNYPSDWITGDLARALGARERGLILIDTLPNALVERADVVLPGATWAEKSGTFENVAGRLQAFERAISPIDFCKGEAQIVLDLTAAQSGEAPEIYNPAALRRRMAEVHGLREFLTSVHLPRPPARVESDMQLVEL